MGDTYLYSALHLGTLTTPLLIVAIIGIPFLFVYSVLTWVFYKRHYKTGFFRISALLIPLLILIGFIIKFIGMRFVDPLCFTWLESPFDEVFFRNSCNIAYFGTVALSEIILFMSISMSIIIGLPAALIITITRKMKRHKK